jgi:DNA-binding MarR family transcriptional regulator
MQDNDLKNIEELNKFINDSNQFLEKKYSIFSSQMRFSVMLILMTHKKVKISELTQLFKISSGKMDHHLRKLEKEGLILKKMVLFTTRARAIIEVTKSGKEMFNEYLNSIKEIIKEFEE